MKMDKVASSQNDEFYTPEDAKSLEIFEFGENCPVCGKAFVLDTDICPICHKRWDS